MRDRDRPGGSRNAIERRLAATVREIDQNTQLIHSGDGLTTKGGQSVVRGRKTSGADQILDVVGELDDPESLSVVRVDPVQIVFEGHPVLKAEDDAELPCRLCLDDIGRRLHQPEDVRVVSNLSSPGRHLLVRRFELREIRRRAGVHREIQGRDAGAANGVERRGAEWKAFLGNVELDRPGQGVDDDGIIVPGPGIHHLPSTRAARTFSGAGRVPGHERRGAREPHEVAPVEGPRSLNRHQGIMG